MTVPKYTPGPWDRQKIPNDPCCHECAVETEDGEHIADVAHEHDASIIAAAPELAEALLALVNRRDRAAHVMGGNPDGSDGRYVKARAALRKAGVL
jgi:hypothetical protein